MGKTFDKYDYFNWQIAICYHPMYMLVDEDRGDPPVGERIPPWGAETAEEYLERVKRNLASLEKDPKLTLNYEWAIHSLEDVAERFPDVHERMRAAAERGQLEFLGGEYSLAHTHTYGSEAAWRQFEYGTELFRTLYGKEITVHAHQEVHIFRQLPQILKYFGFEYLVFPAFPWALTITSGEFELLGYERAYHLRKGDDFIDVEALDGTSIPGFFTTNVRFANQQKELGKDLWSAPPVFIDFPDLEEYHNPRENATPVLLGAAAAERFAKAPPRATGQIHSYYSYCEGIWADAHQRASKNAEDYAIQAGNMLALARLRGNSPGLQRQLDDMWKTVLKYQDHDATWTEMSDLRQKAIDQFHGSQEDASGLMAESGSSMLKETDTGISIFNSLTHPRTIPLELSPDEPIPDTQQPFQQVDNKIYGCVALPALGCRSYAIPEKKPVPSAPATLPQTINTSQYAATLSDDGLLTKLITADGHVVLDADQYLGGEIRCVRDGNWHDNRNLNATFLRGPVCDIVQRTGEVAGVPTRERYLFFQSEPLIKCEVTFDFNEDFIGDFHVEESKINIYHPTSGGPVYCDTQFAIEAIRDEEPIIAQNWVYSGGLIYVNRGTPKHWTRNGLIANTVAYGGDDWTNRIHPDHWQKYNKTFPQPLTGSRTIEYWIIPFGDYNPGEIVRSVDAIAAPATRVRGRADFSIGEIHDPNLVITGLYEKDDCVMARGYQLPTESMMQFKAWEIFSVPLQQLMKQT